MKEFVCKNCGGKNFRIATYGSKFTLTCQNPECHQQHRFSAEIVEEHSGHKVGTHPYKKKGGMKRK